MGTPENDNWQTPAWLTERIRELAPIGLDPTTAIDNPTRARVYFTEDTNALEQPPWGVVAMGRAELGTLRRELCYCNFPFSQARVFAPRLAKEAAAHTPIIALSQAKPGAQWWRILNRACDARCDLAVRLQFIGAPWIAPWDCTLWQLGCSDPLRRPFDSFEFVQHFGGLGDCYVQGKGYAWAPLKIKRERGAA